MVLALPLEHDNGGNCLQPEEKAERPVRWRQAWRQVRNHFGDDIRQIAVMQPELTLRDVQDDNGNYQTVPVARLYRLPLKKAPPPTELTSTAITITNAACQ